MKMGEDTLGVDTGTEHVPGDHPDYASPGRAIAGLRFVRTDPEAVRGLIIAARFWWPVEQPETHWIWHGPMMRNGVCLTPVFRLSEGKGTDGRSARRVAWELLNGKLPSTRRVLLTCDEPRCVRPGQPHTELNHPVDSHDHAYSIGVRTRALQRLERDMRIRHLHRTGLVTAEELGGLFSISRERVRQIIEGGAAEKDAAPLDAEEGETR